MNTSCTFFILHCSCFSAGRKEQTDVIQDTGIIKSPSFAPSPPSTSNSSLSSDFDNLVNALDHFHLI